MRSALRVVIFASLSVAWAQVPTANILPEVPDEQVLAVFDDGAKLTMREFRGLFLALDPRQQQAALQNRKEWVQQFALFRKLAHMAERQHLDQATPTKEVLAFNRMLILMQTMLNANMNATIVEDQDVAKAYEAAKENYKQVKVKVIYISFVSPALAKAGEKGLTEEQAKAKAEKLAAEIRNGADFAKAVRENSDDETSKAKGGDFGLMRRSDNIPDAIRSAVFALKAGEISDPVRQPNGFYILKADELSYRPLSEVREEVLNEAKLQRHKQWLDKTRDETKVQIVDEKFFNSKSNAPSAARK